MELAQSGAIDAICTAPINKAALHADGHFYPGHTELLAELTGGKAERFIQTSLREWAYAQPFHSSAERAGAMRSWIELYNHQRPHAALRGNPPVSRLTHQLRATVIASVPESFPSHRFGRVGGVKPRAATAEGGLGLTPLARTQAQ